jgi:malate permease and related proteins
MPDAAAGQTSAYMLSYLAGLVPMATGVLLGAVLRMVTGIDPKPLGKAALYVFTPCLVFRALVEKDLSAADGGVVLVVILLFVTLGVLGFGLNRVMGWRNEHASAVLLVLLFMNAGNFGISFNQTVYGDVARSIAIIYFAANVVLLNTAGVMIAAGGNANFRQMLIRTAKVPLVWVVPLAFLARYLLHQFGLGSEAMAQVGQEGGLTFMQAYLQGVRIEEVALLKGIYIISQGTVPLLIVILGAQIVSIRPGTDLAPSALPVAIRLLVSPLLAYLFARLVGLEGIHLTVVTVQAAMPAAINNLVLALQFDTRPRLVGAMILVSSIASVITLAVLVMLFPPGG